MTRLRAEDIAHVGERLDNYDNELLRKTGRTLRGLACHAAGVDEARFEELVDAVLLGVVPISSGQGVIPGFCETVERIVTHIGFKAFVTKAKDAAGLAEAFERKASIMMLADDNRFVALNLGCGRVVDNAEATGRGYAAALNLMVGGLQGHKVLVIGCGAVGCSAVVSLLGQGADVSVFDVIQQRCHDIFSETCTKQKSRITIEQDLSQALGRYHLLMDCSPGADIIDEHHVGDETYIASPGMPHGLRGAALRKISDRLIHDPLQTGVATMVLLSVDLGEGKMAEQ